VGSVVADGHDRVVFAYRARQGAGARRRGGGWNFACWEHIFRQAVADLLPRGSRTPSRKLPRVNLLDRRRDETITKINASCSGPTDGLEPFSHQPVTPASRSRDPPPSAMAESMR
jgi:hypothetical protein